MRQRGCLLFLSVLVLHLTASVSSAATGTEKSPQLVSETGVISGRILITNGAPLAWGTLMLYNAVAGPPPKPEKYDRTPDISRTVDSDGRFRVSVPAGKYYLGAIKRMSGDGFGVPQAGDYALLSFDARGALKVYQVMAGATLEVGTIAEARRLEARDLAKQAAKTAIRGVVLDTDGKPVENALVLAYTDLSLRGKPLFVSDRSDSAGHYLLRVAPGTYYLRVRNGLTSGPPAPGDIVGYYGEGMPTPVTIQEGDVKTEVDFTVVTFAGRGPQPGEGP